MASQRPTIQSLMSASYDDTDESGDGSSGDHHHQRHQTLPSFHSRFVDPQKLIAVPPKASPPPQATGTAREPTKETSARNRMNDEMRDGAGTGGEGEAGSQANKGPKRGARACTNCRKGKNRCEGDGPACRRCLQHNLPCVFAKPPAKTNPAGGMFVPSVTGGTDSEGRINYIENHVSSLAATQNAMQQTLSQILSALSGNAAATQPGMAQQQQTPLQPPPPLPPQGSFLPPPPHSAGGNSNVSSGYPLSAPPLSAGHGQGYGYPSGHHQPNDVDLYASGGGHQSHHGGLAPPFAGDRMEAFSPGTVAVLTEVAHHGLSSAGDSGSNSISGRRGVHQSSISSASGGYHQQHQPQASPLGAGSMSSVSTHGTGHPHHQSHQHQQQHPQQHQAQQQHMGGHQPPIMELDFAKPDISATYSGNMAGGGLHLPPLYPMPGAGQGPGSESSPSTMNDTLGTGQNGHGNGNGTGNGISHVRTSSFGWPDVSSRGANAAGMGLGAPSGGGGSSGGGNYLVRRREDSPADSQEEDSFAVPNARTTRGASASGRPISANDGRPPKKYPKLPGFKPPPHRYAQYGLVVPSTAASSEGEEDESEDTLPRSSLNAPIEALQALANAADQAAAQESAAAAAAAGIPVNAQSGTGMEVDVQQGGGVNATDISAAVGSGFLSPPRVLQKQLRFKKRQKAEPTPRNAFPDVITKGLVSESECRELWDIFFSGCHLFIPLWDRKYDVFESFVVRTPFSFDGMMAVASKIQTGNGPLGQTHHRALEEAQGIARSTLFGPVVRKEAVMAVLILAAWSQNGWLPSGHALRMGLDMHLHKALEKLNDNKPLPGAQRSDSEERDLVVSARIWMNCYLNDHMLSLGTGRPLMLKDDESVRGARILLGHPMESETDVRLIACVELMNHKVRVWETLHPMRGRIDSAAVEFVTRVNNDLLLWHKDWRSIHVKKLGPSHVLLDMLDAELYYAQLWCACVALRGCHWEKLTPDQRELAFKAKDAALKCLGTYKSPPLRAYIKYAVHETMVQCSFAAVFLLKIAILFPDVLPANVISLQVAELAHLLSECSAERYALTLRLMLRSFRRKMGENTHAPGTPRNGPANPMSFGGNGLAPMTSIHPVGMQSLLSNGMGEGDNGDSNFMNAAELSAWMDDLGPFNWPEDGFSPSNLPAWIMDSNVTDLGLPFEGSDSIFLPPELADLFLATGPTNWQLGDSAEQGAEAW